MYENISVIVPSLNPDDKLRQVVDGLVEEGFTDIILVDDGSDEEHRKVFQEMSARYPEHVAVLTHDVNHGKGRAMKTAFSHVLEHRQDSLGVVTVDGDNQHKPADVAACVKKMTESQDAVVLGCRDFSLPQVPWKSRNGNKITRNVVRFVCGLKVSDTQTGLRAIPVKLLPTMLQVRGERYEYETNMLLEMGDRSIPCVEVPIETVYIEDNQSSHFHAVRDSIRIYAVILKFLLSSLISCVVDLVVFRIALGLLPATVAVAVASGTTIAGIIARIISSVVNFCVNRRAVFHAENSATKSLVRYYLLAICQLGCSLGLVALFVTVLRVDSDWVKTLIKALVDIFLFFISFRIQRSWVFAGREEK